LEDSNATFEKENMSVGKNKFKIDKKEIIVSNSASFPAEVSLKANIKKNNFIFGIYSMIPGLGQRKKFLFRKSNFFKYSFLGLAVTGTSSYFLSEHYYKGYQDANNTDNIDKNRNRATTFLSLTQGIVLGGAILYGVNTLDAILSNPDIPKREKDAYNDTYRQIKMNLPQKRDIYAKKITEPVN